MSKRFSAGKFAVMGKYWLLYMRIIIVVYGNSSDSFFVKHKQLLFISRDLGAANGIIFYNKQEELCAVWDIISNRWGHLIVHILEHMKRFKKKEFRFVEKNTGIQQSIDGTGEQIFKRNSKTAGSCFSFLMCSGWTFSEQANIYIYFLQFLDHTKLSYLKPHEFIISLYYLIEGNYFGVFCY